MHRLVATSLSDQVGRACCRRRIRQGLLLLAAVSLVVLFADCFDTNEADKLPLALQRLQPTWLPGDWYLNQTQPHQWLFLDLARRYGVVAVVTREGQAGPPGWHQALQASPWWLWLPGSPT